MPVAIEPLSAAARRRIVAKNEQPHGKTMGLFAVLKRTA
jgi:hypothetical protein